jgi:16S rRNA (uracil1498-N3)-methyltransferase
MVEPMFTATLSPEPREGDLFELKGGEAKHAISVRRMRVGEAIQLTDGRGLRVKGSIQSISGNALQLKISSVTKEASPTIQITLVQALAKGDRDELAVQAATELGISQVIPWESDRSVSRWIGIKEQKAVERWQTIATEASKQALRAWHPIVQSPIKGVQVADLVNNFDQVLVLDPTSKLGLGDFDLIRSGKLALVVGPEGGISESELQSLGQAGAGRVHLGESILRTSTAGIAAISGILALTDQWASK